MKEFDELEFDSNFTMCCIELIIEYSDNEEGDHSKLYHQEKDGHDYMGQLC